MAESGKFQVLNLEDIINRARFPFFMGLLQGNIERDLPKRQLTIYVKNEALFEYFHDFFTELFGVYPQLVTRSNKNYNKEFCFYYPKLLEAIRQLTLNNTQPPYSLLKTENPILKYFRGFFYRTGHVGYHARMNERTLKPKKYPYVIINKRNTNLLSGIVTLLNSLKIRVLSYPCSIIIQHKDALDKLLNLRLLPTIKQEYLESLVSHID